MSDEQTTPEPVDQTTPVPELSETDLLLTMPRRYAAILNAQFGNRLLPFPLAAPELGTYVYWHANSAGDPANEWLRQLLLQAFRDGAQPARRGR